MKYYHVYIITNKKNGVLYVGSTQRLKIRITQHKNKSYPKSFSARYNLDKLVYFEEYVTKEEVLTREKQLKKWNREWKINLIEKFNSNWRDLFDCL